MCKSLAEGGNRCPSCLTKNQQHNKGRIDYWQEQVATREAIYDSNPTARNLRPLTAARNALSRATELDSTLEIQRLEALARKEENLKQRRNSTDPEIAEARWDYHIIKQQAEVDTRTAELNRAVIVAGNKPTDANLARLAETQRKLDSAVARLADLEERKTEARLNGWRDSPDVMLGSDLSPREWDALSSTASRLGYANRSQFVRAKLSMTPVFEDRPTVRKNERPKREGSIGRIPTEPAQPEGKHLREARGVRFEPTEIRRLDEEAQLFGLTRSDYVRAVLFDQDPRRFGQHVAVETANYAVDTSLASKEQDWLKANPKGNLAAYWTGQVWSIRERYGMKQAQQLA